MNVKRTFFMILLLACLSSCLHKSSSSSDAAENFDEKTEMKPHQDDYENFDEDSISKNMGKTLKDADLQGVLKLVRKYKDSPSMFDRGQKEKKLPLKGKKLDFKSLLKNYKFTGEKIEKVKFGELGLTHYPASGTGRVPFRYAKVLDNSIIENLQFKDVNVSYTNMEASEFRNVVFENSKFEGALFIGAEFHNVKFINCYFRDTDFSFSNADRLDFDGSVFEYSNMDFVKWKNTKWDNAKFSKTIAVSSVINGKHTDPILNSNPPLDSSKHIGLVFADNFPGVTAYKLYMNVISHGYTPVKIEYRLDQYLNEAQVEKEVKNILKDVDVKQNIPKQILEIFESKKIHFPNLSKLEHFAFAYLDHLDGLIIPGGLDLELYLAKGLYKGNANTYFADLPQGEVEKFIQAEKFPVRTFLELFLIREGVRRELPMFLICRGSQVYNVYRGGGLVLDLNTEYSIGNGNHEREIQEDKTVERSETKLASEI